MIKNKRSFKNNKIKKKLVVCLGILGLVVVSGLVCLYEINNQAEHRLLTDINKPTEAFSAYKGVLSNEIYNTVSYPDIAYNMSDVKTIARKSDYIILAKIDSIDGARNFDPIEKAYTEVASFGKMTVQKVYKGNLKMGEKVNYSRLGGIIKTEEYLKGLYKEQRDKIAYLGGIKQPYVKSFHHGDIEIEAGKNYLIFIYKERVKDSYKDYVISFNQYGLREVKTENKKIKVLNNETKKWEKVEEVVEKF